MENYNNEDYRKYNDELIEKMYQTRIGGMPANFFLLDLRKTNTQCHASSNILSYIINNSKRMTGNSGMISGLDKSHSWVEDDNYAYETTEGLVWKKDIYYKREQVTDVVEISREEVLNNLGELLTKQVSQDMMIAYINDMKFNIIGKPYEKELDIHSYSSKVFEYMQDLRKAYSTINNYAEKQDRMAIDNLLRR